MTLSEILTSPDAALRDRCFDEACAKLTRDELLGEAAALDRLWRTTESLYIRVRTLTFLAALHRFGLPARRSVARTGEIPTGLRQRLLMRDFAGALDLGLEALERSGPSVTLCSALAAGYRALAFDTLAAQVRRAVRAVSSQTWMFENFEPADHPRRLDPALLSGEKRVLRDETPVRMDLSHAGWSDIFFLAMDAPDQARVLNVSIDLAVRGRDDHPRPPVMTTLRTIDEPVIRLRSIDLGASVDLHTIGDVFDFARDHLGLLRAGIVAAGIVPPSLEGRRDSLGPLLERLTGSASRGLELVTTVRGIPKGSRLAVSTNLLASIIAVCMRATGQTESLTGTLTDDERRAIVARAVLGEWLGGSGGGWQDSGGLWPGLKLIEGVAATSDDPEFGVSRGRLLPRHTRLAPPAIAPTMLDDLARSLVLVHGGMAQNVGPVLEMVTERYLLRSSDATAARARALEIFDDIRAALRDGDVRALGSLTHANFFGPITTIIPWATNAFTESLVATMESRYGERFWGFWMLGGMAGGGMGLLFDPSVRGAAAEDLRSVLAAEKSRFDKALPFAMQPVVYDFAVNERGSDAALVNTVIEPEITPSATTTSRAGELDELLADNGFDVDLHARMRDDLLAGRIGLTHNRLARDATIADVRDEDVEFALGDDERDDAAREVGQRALASGRVAVVTLAAGMGTRWTEGAGVVKALNPFVKLAGEHRSFLDVHLAKSRLSAAASGTPTQHVVTTSYLTHEPLRQALAHHTASDDVHVRLSRARAVGLRMVPTERDLRFEFDERPRQRLDHQGEKVALSLHRALVGWAVDQGEASDYRDNLPHQCIHPVGHGFEIPNLVRNGTLRALLDENPALATLLVHNVDTVGASLDPTLLGRHLRSADAFTFEVVPRRIEDQGGGLARIDGRIRLIESLALPRDDDEDRLRFYNSMTTWVDIDALLALMDITRADLADTTLVDTRVRAFTERLPTYVTIKHVKKRWGHGHEDVFPVTQWEKLWGDVTSLSDARCGFLVVPFARGQQLKDPAQLDTWWRDGSAAALEALCRWD